MERDKKFGTHPSWTGGKESLSYILVLNVGKGNGLEKKEMHEPVVMTGKFP